MENCLRTFSSPCQAQNDKLKARWCENCKSNNEAVRYESDCWNTNFSCPWSCNKKCSHWIWKFCDKALSGKFTLGTTLWKVLMNGIWIRFNKCTEKCSQIRQQRCVSCYCVMDFFRLFSFNNAVRFVLFSENNWTARILITRILSLCNDSMCFRWQHVCRLLNA